MNEIAKRQSTIGKSLQARVLAHTESSIVLTTNELLSLAEQIIMVEEENFRLRSAEDAAREEERERCIQAVQSVTMAGGDNPLSREEILWEQALESAEEAIRALAGEEGE